MSIYCEKCRTRIAVGSTCATCGHVNPSGSGSYQYPAAHVTAPPSSTNGATVHGSGSTGFQKSLGGSVTLLIFAAVGAVCPFLPYVTSPYGSVNGWKSIEVFENWNEFSASPVLVLLSSLLSLGIAIGLVSNQNRGVVTNQVVAGVGTLVSGIVATAAAGLAYSSWDSIISLDGSGASIGVGLSLGIICGLAVAIIGIVILTVPKVTGGM